MRCVSSSKLRFARGGCGCRRSARSSIRAATTDAAVVRPIKHLLNDTLTSCNCWSRGGRLSVSLRAQPILVDYWASARVPGDLLHQLSLLAKEKRNPETNSYFLAWAALHVTKEKRRRKKKGKREQRDLLSSLTIPLTRRVVWVGHPYWSVPSLSHGHIVLLSASSVRSAANTAPPCAVCTSLTFPGRLGCPLKLAFLHLPRRPCPATTTTTVLLPTSNTLYH